MENTAASTPRTVGLVDPEALSPRKTLPHQPCSERFPDVSSDLLLLPSRQNSLLSLFLPLCLCNIPFIPAWSLLWGPHACSESPDVGHGLSTHHSPFEGTRDNGPHRGMHRLEPAWHPIPRAETWHQVRARSRAKT